METRVRLTVLPGLQPLLFGSFPEKLNKTNESISPCIKLVLSARLNRMYTMRDVAR
jgi:hypothetical protein